ncbi:MAG TPA: hypothetical protein VF768_11755 [Holophagaceae bacterium]
MALFFASSSPLKALGFEILASWDPLPDGVAYMEDADGAPVVANIEDAEGVAYMDAVAAETTGASGATGAKVCTGAGAGAGTGGQTQGRSTYFTTTCGA